MDSSAALESSAENIPPPPYSALDSLLQPEPPVVPHQQEQQNQAGSPPQPDVDPPSSGTPPAYSPPLRPRASSTFTSAQQGLTQAPGSRDDTLPASLGELSLHDTETPQQFQEIQLPDFSQGPNIVSPTSDTDLLGSQPPVSPLEPATDMSPEGSKLRKTRGRDHDAVHIRGNSDGYPNVSTAAQLAVVSSPPRKSRSPAGRGLSPSSATHGRRSVSAQPAPPSSLSPHHRRQGSQQHERMHEHDYGRQYMPPPQQPYAREPSLSPGPPSTDGSDSRRQSRRRSWFRGSGNRSRSNSVEPSGPSTEATGGFSTPAAWILAADGSRAEYDVSYLINGGRVPELWDENGSLFVYLERTNGRGNRRYSGSSISSNNNSSNDSGTTGASFKVRESVIRESRVLSELARSEVVEMIRSRARSFGGRDTLSVADATRAPQLVSQMLESSPRSPPLADASRLHLHLQVDAADMERLIALRNLFGVLTGQPLVVTQHCPSTCEALLRVADLLRELKFGYTSESFGTAVNLSLDFIVRQIGLADVRFSCTKTLEALLLGEQLRFWPLYSEAFCHAVGKYPALRELVKASPSGQLHRRQLSSSSSSSPASPSLSPAIMWDQISPDTRRRLERAHLDLISRQHNANTRLEQFDFPGLFSGVATHSTLTSSASAPAATASGVDPDALPPLDISGLHFKAWRVAFGEMRAFVLKHYKARFGSWPPKASSRHNPFSESGLNRMVLRTLYSDLCSVYDLLVDRTAVTPRVAGDTSAGRRKSSTNTNTTTSGGAFATVAGASSASAASTAADAHASSGPPNGPPDPLTDPSMIALRQMLAEFDMSSPPVLPPMPFDIPKLPTMASIQENYYSLSPKDQMRFDRGVQLNELQLVLIKSHNFDPALLATTPEQSPFMVAFSDFELREASRRHRQEELADMRIGYWLFIYVVLQSLPMLVVDAPGLRCTDGVEYFLCEPPQGRLPWVEDGGEPRKAWFQTAGSSGPLVELAADVLLYSVDATYQRSHCWLAAAQWVAENTKNAKIAEVAEVADIAGNASGAAAPGSNMGMLPELGRGNGCGDNDVGGVRGEVVGFGPRFPPPSFPTSTSANALAGYAGGDFTRFGSLTSLPSSITTSATSSSSNGSSVTAVTGSFAELTPDQHLQQRRQHQHQQRQQHQHQHQHQQYQHHQQQYQQQYQQLPQQQYQHQQRAQARHTSLGWTLEPVNADPRGERLLPPQGNRLASEAHGRRIASTGNLNAMKAVPFGGGVGAGAPLVPARVSSGAHHSPPIDSSSGELGNTGSTFEDILGSMDKGKKDKKRNTFLPFI